MNDLATAYSIYPSADSILELLNRSKNKTVKRKFLKGTPYWDLAFQLLLSYEFIITEGTGKLEKVILTVKGEAHMAAGGFGEAFPPLPLKENKKTFKQHLDDITGLLTIFGILNAIILFTIQIRTPGIKNPLDFNATRVEFISISMYLLSLVVLGEIIWTTLTDTRDTFKFKVLYFLLCSTTIGVGLVFVTQYSPLLYLAIVTGVFFAVIGLIYGILLKLVLRFLSKKNIHWFSKRLKNISFVLLIISAILSSFVMKLVLSVLKKWIHII